MNAILATLLLVPVAAATGTFVAGPVPADGCGDALPALKHNVGVVQPGMSDWYSTSLLEERTASNVRSDAVFGIYWMLASDDADLYLWEGDCSAPFCASTEAGLAIDLCQQTDCCPPGGLEVRHRSGPAGLVDAPVAYELHWCFSPICVPA